MVVLKNKLQKQSLLRITIDVNDVIKTEETFSSYYYALTTNKYVDTRVLCCALDKYIHLIPFLLPLFMSSV